MGDDNLLDVLRDLRAVTADLKRVVYGDTGARTPGLLDLFDEQQRRIERLESDVRILKQRRPIVWLWVAGYACFVVAWVLAAVGMTNSWTSLNVLDLPGPFTSVMAFTLAIVALVLFVAGFGWLRPE